MAKYSIGVDFGTLSARAVLINLENGSAAAESVFEYPHQVMTEGDFKGVKLLDTDAFQHPADYVEALSNTVKGVLQGVNPECVVGLGIDFTACTVLPVDESGTPLCCYEEFENEPQAYVKLWKHHSAQNWADKITAAAEGREWLARYGGKVSSEWLFPKLMETMEKAPKVFDRCYRFMEAADWLVWRLTGIESHSSCMAGYKGLWNSQEGYPSNEFWKSFDARLENVVGTKVSTMVVPTGTKAGEISELGEEITGLSRGTAVAVPIIDAHAALPGTGIVEPGKLMVIMGTSSCHIVMSDDEKSVNGICGSVQDGVVPGLVAYEAGQACVGDGFDWFIKNCVPYTYYKEAEEKGVSLFELMTDKAKALAVGEGGVLALDWWNGNRTPYVDGDLAGMVVGLTLKTRPEEIYRAFIEATAFGTKAIVDLYEEGGVKVDEIFAAGGISQKNALVMQIYADVLGMEIRVPLNSQAGAKGSAVFASVAGGCFDDLKSAAAKVCRDDEIVYTPNPENTEKYKGIYAEYRRLSEYFAKNKVNKA